MKTLKKLTLNRETLRNLTAEILADVKGGSDACTYGCTLLCSGECSNMCTTATGSNNCTKNVN